MISVNAGINRMMRLIVAISFMSALISTSYAKEYVKKDGFLSLNKNDSSANFIINASHGQASGVCNIEGEAVSIGAMKNQKNRWAYSDSSSMCVMVISEFKNGTVEIMTRDCEGYCGLSAVGSMDGIYKVGK